MLYVLLLERFCWNLTKVQAGTPIDVAREFNKNRGQEGYEDTVYVFGKQRDTVTYMIECYAGNIWQVWQFRFEELVTRYEEPEARNRWDSPLFTVIYDDESIPGDKIWDAVILRKPPPPNMSTISVSINADRIHWFFLLLIRTIGQKPVSDTNYVYELDRVTLEIINAVIEGQKEFGPGGLPMAVPNATAKVINPVRTITLSELRRLRKQFVSINKMRTTLDTNRLGDLFVDYLNTNLS